MITLVDNVPSFHPQRLPLAGPEPDFMAQRGARQPRLPVPHDLVPRFRVMPAVPVSAEMRNQAHGVAELPRCIQAVLGGVVAQEAEFGVGEHQLRFAVGDLPAEQRHHHDAPGDDGVDRDRPLQPLSGAEQQEFDAATGLQDAEEVLEVTEKTPTTNFFFAGVDAFGLRAGGDSASFSLAAAVISCPDTGFCLHLRERRHA